jgi:putative peptide zinc metalloprotease protein
MLYTVAAVIYRWFILLSILMFLYKVFEPYGLKIIGQGIAAMSLYGLIVMPLYKLGKFFYVPGRLHKVKKPRMYATLAALAALILTILFLPLPYTVMTTLEVKARDAASVYVDVPGRLDAIRVQPGDRVANGDLLAELSSQDLDLEMAQLTSDRDQAAIRLTSLKRQRHYRTTEAGGQIPEAREALETAEERLEKGHSDRRRLSLVAPEDGTVLPPPWVLRREDPDGRLPGWAATPLETENLGCYLEEGTLFCQVGDPDRMEASLVIDQSYIDFIEVGQQVEIKLDELPHEIFEGKIEEVSPDVMRYTPKRLSTKAGGELATETDESGVERPQSASYQARVYLDDPESLLRIGLRGRGKVHARPQTIAARAWRFFSETFNFRL